MLVQPHQRRPCVSLIWCSTTSVSARRGRQRLSGGAIGAGGLPVPGKKIGDMPGRVIGDAGEQVGEIKLRVEVVEFGAFDQRVHRSSASATGIGAGEQPVFAADRNRPVILPMSGTRSRSTIAGTRSMGVTFDASMLRGAPAVRSFTSR